MTVTIPENDGCPWPVDPACLEDEWESAFDEPTKERAVALASSTLRRLTGYRVGGCPTTIRPCGDRCGWTWDVSGWNPFAPVLHNGVWTNCGCPGPCSNPHMRIKLPPPVGSVDEVRLDGAVLTEGTDYWVDNGDVVSLGDPWPRTQNLDLPDTQPNTFSITYLNGYPVDGMGAAAAGRLALQYARACSGGKCDLPATVTQVVRQGVSYSLPAGAFPNGETGIREVDAYIALWNPKHRRMPPRVYAP